MSDNKFEMGYDFLFQFRAAALEATKRASQLAHHIHAFAQKHLPSHEQVIHSVETKFHDLVTNPLLWAAVAATVGLTTTMRILGRASTEIPSPLIKIRKDVPDYAAIIHQALTFAYDNAAYYSRQIHERRHGINGQGKELVVWFTPKTGSYCSVILLPDGERLALFNTTDDVFRKLSGLELHRPIGNASLKRVIAVSLGKEKNWVQKLEDAAERLHHLIVVPGIANTVSMDDGTGNITTIKVVTRVSEFHDAALPNCNYRIAIYHDHTGNYKMADQAKEFRKRKFIDHYLYAATKEEAALKARAYVDAVNAAIQNGYDVRNYVELAVTTAQALGRSAVQVMDSAVGNVSEAHGAIDVASRVAQRFASYGSILQPSVGKYFEPLLDVVVKRTDPLFTAPRGSDFAKYTRPSVRNGIPHT